MYYYYGQIFLASFDFGLHAKNLCRLRIIAPQNPLESEILLYRVRHKKVGEFISSL